MALIFGGAHFSVVVIALLPEKVGANLKVRDGPNRALTSKALFKSIAIHLELINQSAHAFSMRVVFVVQYLDILATRLSYPAWSSVCLPANKENAR